jgi:MFS family permease
MIHEAFMGRNPSHFHVNSLVKAYIFSESLLWSAWNFITPIFAVFVVNNISNGNIEVAATGYSVYLISRVIFELIAGRFLSNTDDRKKLIVAITGISILSFAYIGFALSNTLIPFFLSYIIVGIGFGIASPAKNSLFAMHLDHNKEATEWGIADASTFICTALAAVLGGFIATTFGFKTLFLIACVINVLSIIPYALHLTKAK